MAGDRGPRHIDVLWLVEHVDRELDVAISCGIELERRFGLTVEIANYYADFERITAEVVPNVVLVPFFFSADDIGSKEYLSAWPGATIINLRWEQILYKANSTLKQLRGDVARDTVPHVAWSADSRDELLSQGAQPQNLLLTGNPLWSLYERPYRNAFVPRADLARQHGLDPGRQWLFFPENYRWAFVKDSSMRKLEARGTGITADQLSELRTYCLDSLRTVLGWLDSAARDEAWEVIFRPRPSTNTEKMHALVAKVLPDRAARLHVIKEHSVRDWALASDHVMSSFSTSLIEASLAGKPINTVSPSPVPELLRYEWCDLVQDLTSCEAIGSALRDPHGKAAFAPTAAWARARFQPRGNPMIVLAEEIGRLATRHRVGARTPVVVPVDRPPLVAPKGFFSRLTHDKDAWTPAALSDRKLLFEQVILEPGGATSQEAGDPSGTSRRASLSVIICTHNRSDRLQKLLDSLLDQDPHDLDLEILVVDNRSTDGTMTVCRDRQAGMPALRYCFEPALGLSHARNRGVAAATRPHVLYLDDDATVPRHYLQVAERIISEHDPDFFGGPVFPAVEGQKPHWFHDQFEVRKYTSEPQFIFDRSISGGNFGIRRSTLQRLGGFDPSFGMSGRTMSFMEERAIIELYRFLTPRRLQKIFYHPQLFISHHTGPLKLTLSYQTRRAFKAMQARVILENRFALASGARPNLSGEIRNELTALLVGARNLVVETARNGLSGSFRLTPAGAKAIVKTARALGGLSGCVRLKRNAAFQAPPREGVLFVRPSRIAGLPSTEEERDRILSVADEVGIRAGLLDTDSKTDQPLEMLLRRERFRTYRRVVVLGYLPAPVKSRLRSFARDTELMDFADVPSPPPLTGMDPESRAACARWLRELSSAEGARSMRPREGVLMIAGGASIKKTLLGREASERVLDWFQRSGLRADFLRVKGGRVVDLVVQAGGPSYKTILALGVMSAESKRELKQVVGDADVADLEDIGCSRDAFRAVADAPSLETALAAAPLLDALRKLAGAGAPPRTNAVASNRSAID